MNLEEKIKEYWEDENTRSLIDVNLRMLEENVVKLYLESNNQIIDLGCGDGVSTLEYALKVKCCVGIERSKYLLKQAQKNLLNSGLCNTTFTEGDIMEIDRFKAKFDVAITQRVLINLTSWREQQQAIDNIYSVLKPGGLYIMIEDTYDGLDAMNDFRKAAGLKEIAVHWHNLYFHHNELTEFLASRFKHIRHHTFDLYYLLTRVYLNMIASFKGFGKNAVKDPIFDIADPSARNLYEIIGDKVRIGNGPSFGPIQGFVLQK